VIPASHNRAALLLLLLLAGGGGDTGAGEAAEDDRRASGCSKCCAASLLQGGVLLYLKENKNLYQIKFQRNYHESVLRIRDVYPGSRILIFTHPGSRISYPRSKISRGVKNNLLLNIFL